MAIIKCKMCGGDIELSADRTFGTCSFCGCTMTLPRIDDEQRAAAFNRGNHFRRIGEFDKALSVYERIVQEDENDAEAHWCCALCRFGIEYVEDPTTYEWLPTCHRASFDSFLEDVDCLAAIEHSDGLTRRQYQRDAAKIAEVQRGILATSQNEEPFDVFISYKELDDAGNRTVDSTLAQDIYYQLTEKGYRVFFSRITLEDKVGTEYEPYIFAALNSAKVMIAVGTKPEHFNAVWVKNEWSRFLAMMRKDRSKLLLPCYRGMDPYDLPEQLSVLMSYDMGKIGFIQDLIRGVSKVLDAEKKPEPTVVVQQTAQASSAHDAMLKRGYMSLEDGDFDKADDFFEQVLNQDAECAESYCGKVLAVARCRNDAEWVKSRLDATKYPDYYPKLVCTPDTHHIEEMCKKLMIPAYLRENDIKTCYAPPKTYDNTSDDRKAQLEAEKKYFASDKLISRAVKFAKGDFRTKLEKTLGEVTAAMQKRIDDAKKEEDSAIAAGKEDYADSIKQTDAVVQRLHDEACEKREADYRKACELMSADTVGNYQDAILLFEKTARSGYKDSGKKKADCEKRIKELEAQAKEETLAKRYGEALTLQNAAKTIEAFADAKAAFEALGAYRDSKDRASACRQQIELLTTAEKKKAKRKKIIIGIAAAIVAALLAVYMFVIKPMTAYNAAQKLEADGKYIEAAMKYGAAGDLNDARAKSYALWENFAVRDMISAGRWHTVGLRSDGTVVAVGDNDYGQCNVSGWKDIVAISAGDLHTVGLRSDGTVVAVGNDAYGRCDVSGWKDIVAISAGRNHTVGLRSDGTVVATKIIESEYIKDHGQCEVSGWTDIVAISTDYYHTVGLRSDGTVVAVGDNDYGRCNVSGWKDIVAISAGERHTVGLRSDGTIVAVGYKAYGQCDVSGWTNIKLPKK